MTRDKVDQIIKSIGLETRYSVFPDQDCPALPYITYVYPSEDKEGADDVRYGTVARLDVILYAAKPDFATEDSIQETLDESEISVMSKTSSYIRDDAVWETIFECEVYLNG